MGPRVWDGVHDRCVADAIAFGGDGRVTAVGKRELVLRQLPPGAWVLEAAGTVVPAFVDAHVHIRASAMARLAIDCRKFVDRDSLLQCVESAARGARPGGWVTLVGLESELVGPRLPTREELDRAAPDNPVRIRHRSLHAWLLNSRAATIVASTLGCLPPDGLVADDRGAIRRAFGRVSETTSIEAAAREWSERRLRSGVVAVVDATVTNGPAELEQLGDWRRRGVVRQHVVALSGEAQPRPAGGAVTVIGTKLMFAGERRSVKSARSRIAAAWRRGQVAAVHCADLASLGDTIAAVEGISPPQRRTLRIEHAAICPPEWIPRIAQLPAAVVAQPSFVRAHGDRYRRRHSEMEHDWLHRLRSWVRAGVTLAAGSDEPAGPGDPIEAWRSAVDRRTANGYVLGPSEALTRRQAFAALTSRAADVSALPWLGRLRPGDPGNAVLLVGDALAAPALNGVTAALVVRDGSAVDHSP